MPIVEYTPADFDRLHAAALKLEGGPALLHRPFVDYYYATRDWCRLFLLLSPAQNVEGLVGVELLRFQTSLGELLLGFGSNYYVLQHGAGGYLFRKWMSFSRTGVVFGGSPYTHRVIQSQNWTYYPGIKTLTLNYPYPVQPGEPWWRVAAKHAARRVRRKRIGSLARQLPPDVRRTLRVKEEETYDETLLPRQSPFTLRFAPTVEHLDWRYNTRLSFVRYRLFRILRSGVTAGYVILNDSPSRILVAQCDGADPECLAYGVLLSLVEAAGQDERTVTLASSHPAMQRIYSSAGFRPSREERAFALGGLKTPGEAPADTSHWLVNLDWGDNGLRPPFLDQPVVL